MIDAIKDAYQSCIPYYEEVFASLKIRQIENIKNILSPKRKTDLRIDNALIDLGWVTKSGQDARITSIQMERFFREKLGIQPGVFSRLKSLFQKK